MKKILKAHSKIICDAHLKAALKELGIKKGDTLCVHSALLSLGQPLLDKNDFLRAIIDALFYAIGPRGSLIMPTFTYSFTKNKNYDKKFSKSTVGILGEFFRQNYPGFRTDDPIFSFFVSGKNQKFFHAPLPSSCFGKKCIYEKLIKKNAKIILFGDAELGYTLTHFCEERVGVSYRFFKSFSGSIIDEEGRTKERTIKCFLRRDLNKYDLIIPKQIALLKKEKNYKIIKFANGHLVSINAKKYFKTTMKLLKENEGALI